MRPSRLLAAVVLIAWPLALGFAVSCKSEPAPMLVWPDPRLVELDARRAAMLDAGAQPLTWAGLFAGVALLGPPARPDAGTRDGGR